MLCEVGGSGGVVGIVGRVGSKVNLVENLNGFNGCVMCLAVKRNVISYLAPLSTSAYTSKPFNHHAEGLGRGEVGGGVFFSRTSPLSTPRTDRIFDFLSC